MKERQITQAINFWNTYNKKDKRIGQKRTEMSEKLIDTSYIKALKKLDKYNKSIPINININSNKIINDLIKFKKFEYRFSIENILFS